MRNNNNIAVLGFKLFAIAAVAGLLLGITNEITKGPIEQQAIIAAENARKTVCPDADSFENMELAADAVVDNLYTAKSGDEIIGYSAQITVKGFGGEVEIVVGIDTSFCITGISIGGNGFSETPGLGAKAKEPWFSAQYTGKDAPVELNKDVDAITAATITSRAINDGINDAIDYIRTVVEGDEIHG